MNATQEGFVMKNATLKDMIAAGRYDLVDLRIAHLAATFNTDSFSMDRLELWENPYPMEIDEIEKTLRREKVTAAGLVQLLAFGALRPDVQRFSPVVAAGTKMFDPDGDTTITLVPILGIAPLSFPPEKKMETLAVHSERTLSLFDRRGPLTGSKPNEKKGPWPKGTQFLVYRPSL